MATEAVSSTKSNATGSTVVKKKKQGQSKIYFWASECKYSVILDLVQELEWKLIDDERLQPKPWQMINHFPGMPNIARKNRMGQNLNYMQKLFPKEYSFYPRTWVLPGEMADFRQQFDGHGNSLGNKIFIIKPDAGCQGRGIFLTRTIENVPFNENVVAQVYIKKPLLLDGFKFDLRLYCLVLSVKPLRMYLFHDGLVRMCTEEYVKPTKDNLGVSCMHLTNYAVNKHNENFQQPAAQSSEDYNTQDDASKRSLLWFMNWVKKEHGEGKANWLWKRMGILCTRTILAILPTLSREYDQHFKSFNGIPVDISKIPVSNSSSVNPATILAGFSPTAAAAAAAAHLKPPPLNLRSSASSAPQRHRASSKDRESAGSDNEEDDEHKKTEAEATNAEQNASEAGGGESGDGYPKMRGSRCFEVLGFDIMVDSNLNPWLIEVNHLPSFGTDSPLDKDIKDRLMRQVFSVLPTMADDQAAYAAFHKAESEKRLNAHKAAKERELQQLKEKPMKPSGNVNGSVKSKRESSMERVSPSERGNVANGSDENNSPQQADGEEGQDSRDDGNESYKDIAATESENRDGAETAQDGLPNENQAVPDDMLEIIDEECTPERVEEIKEILLDIYQKRSPEKINKIDRLLAKYSGHEEEFLLFVFSKYNVSPNEYEKSKPKSVREAIAARSNSSTNQGSGSQNEASQDGSKNSEAVASDKAKPAANNNNNRESKRYSRSLSPPRNSGPRRIVPAWKSSAPEEDLAFKNEILSIHIPNENDEWMKFEMSRLTQCTRIFPPEPKAEPKAGEDDVDVKEEEENEEENDGQQEQKVKKDGTSSKTKTVATYEDIIYKLFLEDKRATYRRTRPLPNRSKTDEGNFLPPLDPPSTSRSSFSSMGTGKGVVGWKAPPKPESKKEAPKILTPSQQESAKRLSQGLSVAQTARQKTNPQAPSVIAQSAEAQYLVVLDPQEYAPNGGPAGANMNGYVPVQNGAYTNGNYILWPSTKAHRLYEESRSNRMKIEAARAHNAAVLRQQIFFFDPTQEMLNAEGGSLSANSLVLGGMNGTSSVSGDVATQQARGGGFPSANPSLVNGSLHESSFVYSTNPGSQVPNQAVYSTQIPPSGIQQQHLRARLPHQPGQQTVYTNLNGVPVAVNPQTQVNSGYINPAQMRLPVTNNLAASSGHQVGGVVNSKQEELLRQLFPSWF